MPANIDDALSFLKTQWSSINENKIKGIVAETQFRQYLEKNNIHFIPGGWILVPGKNTKVDIPSKHKICLLPMEPDLSWAKSSRSNAVTLALISAYNYFRTVGVTPYIVMPEKFDEAKYEVPQPSQTRPTRRAVYPRPYELMFNNIEPNGDLIEISIEDVFANYPERDGNRGLRCYAKNKIDRHSLPWNDADIVRGLFWFEYARYYCQIPYLISNNDLDLFIIGKSGAAYPVELKSKSPAEDPAIGEWFGLDIGPFAKMTFFTANSMSTDALYIVQEVDEQRNLVDWLGIKFTDLVKNCSWVGQAGGLGMGGGASSTVKVPKLAFTKLPDLFDEL